MGVAMASDQDDICWGTGQFVLLNRKIDICMFELFVGLRLSLFPPPLPFQIQYLSHQYIALYTAASIWPGYIIIMAHSRSQGDKKGVGENSISNVKGLAWGIWQVEVVDLCMTN